jgi:hypothetical protein
VRWKVAGPLFLLLAATACQEESFGPTVQDYQTERDALAKKLATESGGEPTQTAQAEGIAGQGFGGAAKGYRWDPSGKRDPFRSFVLDIKAMQEVDRGPLAQFDLAQLSVVAVIWADANKRALVEDPSGRSYIVGEGAPIGKNNGKILRIDDNLVLVQETYSDLFGDSTSKDIEMRIRHTEGG